MRKILFILCLLFSVIFINSTLFAQMVGDNIYLQGKYVEIGIAPNGGFGSTKPAPTGYHPFNPGTSYSFYDPGSGTTTSTTGTTSCIGFVADYGRDGWTVGTPPYFGDYYLPGDPQEGWAIQVGGTVSEAYIPAYEVTGATGYTGGLAGTNVSYSTVGGISKGVWHGTDGALDITQTTTLDTTKLYFTVNVIMRNTGATALPNIYYVRTVDPDNDETRSGSFTTSNTITYQLPDAGNKVLVSTTGTTYTNSYLGLGTKDCRAKCMIFNSGLAPTYSLDQLYNESGTSYYYSLGYNYVADVGVALVYNIGTLAPGDSTSLTYAYILNAAYIDSALDATQTSFLVNSYTFNSGDSINLCTYNFDTVLVSMGSASFYKWKWLPDSLLANDSAVSNTINVTGITSPLTYTITGVNVAGACDTVVNLVTFTHGTFDITLNNIDTNICLGNTVTGSVTGPPLLNYSWSPVAGVSNTGIPSPTFTPTTTTTYAVTASSASGCPSITKSFTINVVIPPVVTVDSPIVKTCSGIPAQLNAYVAPAGFAYSYSWSPSATLNNTTISNPTATSTTAGDIVYTVLVYAVADSMCTSTTTVDVHTIPDTLSIHPTDTMICQGKSVQVIGFSDPAFSFQWIPTAGIPVSNVLNAFITPDTSATYVVTGTYALCPILHDTLRLTVQPVPEVYISNNRLLCQYDTLHLKASVSPAWYSGYSYLWSPAAGLDNTTLSTVVFSGNASTTIYCTVTTPAGCTSQDSVAITVFPGNFASMMPDSVGFCPHQSYSLSPAAPAGTTYHWYPAMYLSDSLGANPVINPITSQVYTVIATSVNGCKDTFYFSATVFPAGILYLPQDSITLYPGESYHIQPMTNCTSFVWFPPSGLSDANVADPTATSAISTKYVVNATTENGCAITDSINIFVDVASTLATPNAFTPGAGINNEFQILKRGIASLNYFRVYDRWGVLLFETNNIDQGWDGTYKGAPQPFGVYVYEIQAVTSEGTIFNKHGNVTLLR